MPRRAAVIAAVAVSAPGVLGSSISFPDDNSRERFRSEADRFYVEWDPLLTLAGKVSSSPPHGDFYIHTDLSEPSAASSWVDLLYPVKGELEFMGSFFTAWCRQRWWLSYAASCLYLVGLWAGTAWMKAKEPYNLKVPLAIWNLFLAVFSFIGAARTAPHLLMILRTYGFEYTVCRAALPMYGTGACGLWTTLFIFSKYFELIDTVFLVVRKRPVTFLHWYHHCSVLMYCWHAFVWEMPTGIYFVSMNYTVHAIMYFYYFLAATCKRPPKWALFVTILQLLQMVVGIFITVSHLRILVNQTVNHCDGYLPNLMAALGMYASYFFLFAQFLFLRYCWRREATAGAATRRKDGGVTGANSKKVE